MRRSMLSCKNGIFVKASRLGGILQGARINRLATVNWGLHTRTYSRFGGIHLLYHLRKLAGATPPRHFNRGHGMQHLWKN